jgi:hypothetical protein
MTRLAAIIELPPLFRESVTCAFFRGLTSRRDDMDLLFCLWFGRRCVDGAEVAKRAVHALTGAVTRVMFDADSAFASGPRADRAAWMEAAPLG